MGQALARLHRVKNDRFGPDTHAYWGCLYQDNTPLNDWPTFFWERRLVPRLTAAVASGHLPLNLASEIKNVGDRLLALCGPTVQPSLLHGDAHQNNFLSTTEGSVLIDPSVYYGHPEIDLAHVDFFSPVPDDFFQGYQEKVPLSPGFDDRRDLWRLPTWLAMVEVDGPQHVDSLRAALRHCV